MTEPLKADYSISMVKANVYSLFFALPFAFFFSLLFILRWGPARFGEGFSSFAGNLPVFLGVFAVGVAAHELIHGITWALAGRLPLKAVRFGFLWKTLTPYAHLSGPLEVNAYRTGALMPGLLLGALPAALAIITGSGWLLAFGMLFIVAACGDMLIVWLIRSVPAGRLVEDHPTRAGCCVIAER